MSGQRYGTGGGAGPEIINHKLPCAPVALSDQDQACPYILMARITSKTGRVGQRCDTGGSAGGATVHRALLAQA